MLKAILCAAPGPICITTDCLSVVSAYDAGAVERDEPSSQNGGIWRQIKAALASRPLNLVWMPAHTGADDVGLLEKSDGSLLSAADRAANEQADKLAKAAAAASRVPEATRKEITNAATRVGAIARGLAQVLSAAAHFPVGPNHFVRDVAPLPRSRAAGGTDAAPRRRPPPPPARPPALGGHTLRGSRDRVRCEVCGRSSTHRAKFAASVCPGARATAGDRHFHTSHRCQSCGGITWCTACGAYGALRPVGLFLPCLGRPQSASTAHRLSAMMRGFHPRTGTLLQADGPVQPLQPADGQSGSARIEALRSRIRLRSESQQGVD